MAWIENPAYRGLQPIQRGDIAYLRTNDDFGYDFMCIVEAVLGDTCTVRVELVSAQFSAPAQPSAILGQTQSEWKGRVFPVPFRNVQRLIKKRA